MFQSKEANKKTHTHTPLVYLYEKALYQVFRFQIGPPIWLLPDTIQMKPVHCYLLFNNSRI